MLVGFLFSFVGATRTGLVSGSRIASARGGDGNLPPILGRTNPVHKTPAIATVLFAGLALIVLWVYLLGSSSVQGAFTNVVGSVGLMFALFYAATGIGMAVYYRKLAVRSAGGFIELMLVPGVSAAFLLWVAYKSVPGLGGWTGAVLQVAYVMLRIRVILLLVGKARGQTDYYNRPVEAYDPASAGPSDPLPTAPSSLGAAARPPAAPRS